MRVVGPRGSGTGRQTADEIPVHRYPRLSTGRGLSDPLEQKILESQMGLQLAWDLTVNGADIIHSHVLYPAGFIGAKLGRILNKPNVMTPHGVDINVDRGSDYGMRLNPRLRQKINLALASADAVTAISEGVYSELLNTPVEAARIKKIPNGVDLERFAVAPPRHSVLEELGLTREAKIILTVGNYTPLKGHEDIVRAMPAILQQEPKAALVVVGANTGGLRELAHQLNVTKSVVLTGPIGMPTPSATNHAADRLAEIYRNSVVYVSSSNREGAEGLSLSLLDAMAASLPIVATNIVGNRDVVEAGKNGFLIEPGNASQLEKAVVEILSNGQLAETLGSAGLKKVQYYSWSSIAEQYESVYEEALHG